MSNHQLNVPLQTKPLNSTLFIHTNFLIMKYFFSLIFFLFYFGLTAQKFIQVEKSNSTKTVKWYIGNEINIQLEGEEDNWRKYVIQDIDYENKTIEFPTGKIALSKIAKVRTEIGLTQKIGNTLMTFGLAATAIDGISIAINRGGGFFIIVGPISFVTGWLIKKLFKYKTYKMSKDIRLRAMDLTLVPYIDKA
jgi:hypothetical protein